MKVLFACGGSGGHITPAIAMAEIIQKQFPGAECAFVGNENGMERQMAYDDGYPFFPMKIEGLHRSLTLRNFRTLLLAAKAPARARHKPSGAKATERPASLSSLSAPLFLLVLMLDSVV